MKTRFKDRYLSAFTRYPQQTKTPPFADTKTMVVIPCLNEPNIHDTIDSLLQADDPASHVEILVVVNHASDAPEEIKAYNEATYQELKSMAHDVRNPKKSIIPLWFGDLKPKLAGVGTARKVGMDEAVYRFYQINQPNGILLCLDADCRVAGNYFTATEAHFARHPSATGAAIAFEHPLNTPYYQAIVDFELYLRYYKNALHWAGCPYAYHTIGSTMAVPCDTYQKVGGMNKQKAGEDFYFIEKLVHQGHFTEINDTTVYPSPRQSLRVPFGTGQAIADYTAQSLSSLPVFNPESFEALRQFIAALPQLYTNKVKPEEVPPEPLVCFLEKRNWEYYLKESLHYAHSRANFLKRFFHWFDAFKVLQFLHYARDHFYPNVPVLEACQWLYTQYGYGMTPPTNAEAMLEHWRWHDRQPSTKPNKDVPF